ncbi:MAG: hypothetical protein IT383_08715 [Deltaproteobacteria bacterium]|nr:hypothetical protein [Deltaproteobacteria bacterium]
MDRHALSTPAALLLAVVAAACGDDPSRLTPLPATEPAPVATVCDAQVTDVQPIGVLPAARSTTIIVSYSGHALAGQVKARVSGPHGEVPSTMTLGAGVLELRPNGLLAPGAHLVELSVCNSHAARLFDVGHVHHALDTASWTALAGERFGMDLRYGTIVEPAPRAGRELIVRQLLGGAVVIDLSLADEASLLASVSAGVLGEGGEVALAGTAVPPSPVLLENPYGLTSFARLELTANGRALSLGDGTLVLGFTDAGLADARLSAEVDLRAYGEVDGLAACEVLALHTMAGCRPCASDGEPSCFALTLEGLRAAR